MRQAGIDAMSTADLDQPVVMLVRYPTRRQFIEMTQDPDYQAIAPIRAAALADSRVVESTQLLPKDIVPN